MRRAGVAIGGAALVAVACRSAGVAHSSVPHQPSVAPESAQAETKPPEPAVERTQLLIVGESPGLSEPIAFDNRAFLRVGQRWVAIEGDQLRATPEYEPQGIVVGATGSFPEQAWLLVSRKDYLVPPLRWTRDHWHAVSGFDDVAGVSVRSGTLCRWGERHVLLRAEYPDGDELGRSWFQLLDSNERPPDFSPADGSFTQTCVSRVKAESCFTQPDGGLVVVGAACGAREQAFEYFGPHATQGVPIQLSSARSQPVWIKSGSSGAAGVYLGGSLTATGAPYLVQILAAGEVREIDVPGSIDAIERVATDDEGSVWVDAPLRGHKIRFDGEGLWRRSASGAWTHALIESHLPDKPDWRVNIAGYGLFSAAGSVWFAASYFAVGPGTDREPGVNLLYRNRPTRNAAALRPQP